MATKPDHRPLAHLGVKVDSELLARVEAERSAHAAATPGLRAVTRTDMVSMLLTEALDLRASRRSGRRTPRRRD